MDLEAEGTNVLDTALPNAWMEVATQYRRVRAAAGYPEIKK
jgi:hypothetical protein